MDRVNVHEAKTHLSQILARVEAGEEIVIARAGRAIARLVPHEELAPNARILGRDEGLFEVPADFDSPLPDEIIRGFTG